MVRQAEGIQYRSTTYSTTSIRHAFATVPAAARWPSNRPLVFRVHFPRNRTRTRTVRLRGRSGEAPGSTTGGREFTHGERTAPHDAPFSGEKAGMSAAPARDRTDGRSAYRQCRNRVRHPPQPGGHRWWRALGLRLGRRTAPGRPSSGTRWAPPGQLPVMPPSRRPVRRPEPPTGSRESAHRTSTVHEPSAVRTH